MLQAMAYEETTPEMLQRLEATGKWSGFCKVDGDNFLLHVTGKGNDKSVVQLVNRHGNNYTPQFPEIVAGLGVKKGVTCVLNGELAYYDKSKGVFDFNTFRSRQGLQNKVKIMQRRIQYPCKAYIFDLVSINGEHCIGNSHFPFRKRYEILQSIVYDNEVTELLKPRVDLHKHFIEECAAGREGIMIKNEDNIYTLSGRTSTILKVKNWHFTPVTFTKFEANNAGVTLENSTGDRVLVAGKQAELIRAILIQQGSVTCNIRHLQDRTANGRMREPTYHGVKQ